MQILSEQDEEIYYPLGLVDPPKALAPLVAYLTSIVEGPLGASRPLLRQLRTESHVLHANQRTIFVDGWPLDASEPLSVSKRVINGRSRYRRRIFDSSWQEISSDHYEATDRIIELLPESGQFSQHFRSLYRCGPGEAQTEIKIEYMGGFDFSADPLMPEAAIIKYALGQLLHYHVSALNPTALRIQSEDVYQESKISYFGNQVRSGNQAGISTAGGFPEYLLVPFRQYRPYQYRF
jgi:hypothetical protein